MATPKFKPKTVLLIPDPHVVAGDDLKRFYAMKAWVAARGVELDNVVCIGDLFDFEALSFHDVGQPHWYTKRFAAELECGMKAIDIMEQIVRNSGTSKCGLYLTLGNHEQRFLRFVEADPRVLHGPFTKTVPGLIGLYRPDTKLKCVSFLKPLILDGVNYQHYVVSGLMGRAVSGERPAGTILKTQFMSTVVGHSHTLDFAERTKTDGQKIFALVGGCFVNPKTPFKFAGAARKLWWNGFHLLHQYAPGMFDVESVALERIG